MSEIQIKTTPRDVRFPNTNQAQHCWTRYNEWVLCLKRTGSDEEACKTQRQFMYSICPSHHYERWDEERDAGNFAGIQMTDDEPKKGKH
jgi:cytochrome c oxidase subunit 6b